MKTLKALQQNDLDAVALAVGEMFVLFDCTGKTRYISEAAAHFLRKPQAELEALNVFQFFGVEDLELERCVKAFRGKSSKNEGLEWFSSRFRCKLDQRNFGIVVVPYGIEGVNESCFALGFVPDATALGCAPGDRRGYALELLAAGIAHDFNNLLTGILGNLSLARSGLESSEKRETSLLAAEKAAVRAQDLTLQLLSFSKGGTPVKEEVSMAELLEEATRFLLCGGKYAYDISVPRDLASVCVDAGQMSQVLNNILLNGIEASPGAVRFNIEAQNIRVDAGDSRGLSPGDYVHISIADNGPGIPEEHLSKIFHPYYSTKPEGSGLGLANAYGIISSHGGFLSAESVPGQGATFHIYLPVAQRALRQKPLVDAPKVHSGHGRVLIMDDESMIHQIAGEMLEHLGYDVDFAFEGENAVQKYESAARSGKPYDTVILDLTVPSGMGGRAAIEQLRAKDPQVRAIVSSGYLHDAVMENYRDYGFSGRVLKPYTLEQLSQVLHDVLYN
ncbi:MAG: hypothetical protein Tsb0018_01830 [Opitutales bacterium]